jgi:hypothetical protein
MAKKTTAKKTETYAWLMTKNRNGVRRVEKLTWHRLSKMFRRNAPNSPIRKAILAECRRLGYTPKTILTIHA